MDPHKRKGDRWGGWRKGDRLMLWLDRWRIQGRVGGGWRLASTDPQEDGGGGGHGMDGTSELEFRDLSRFATIYIAIGF